MTRHVHDNERALSLPLLDDGDETGLHSHVFYFGDRVHSYSVVVHNHEGYEASRCLVPEADIVEHLAWVATTVEVAR